MEIIYSNKIDNGCSVVTVKYYSYAYQKIVFEVFLTNSFNHTLKCIVLDTLDEAYLTHLKYYEEWSKL